MNALAHILQTHQYFQYQNTIETMQQGQSCETTEIPLQIQQIPTHQQFQNAYRSPSTAYDFIEEQLEANNDRYPDYFPRQNTQTITINKDKLMSYVLTEHNPNLSPHTTTTNKTPKQFSIRNAEKKYQITNNTNKQNSIKTLKLISHKIGQNHQRMESKLKTECDKQNQIELILSNLKKEGKQEISELKKNSSAIVLKKQHQRVHPFSPFSPNITELNPPAIKKGQTVTSCTKSFSLTKLRPLSRFSTSQTLQLSNSEHICKIIHEVQHKQGNAQEQRTHLEKKAQLLHDEIQREKTLLQDLTNHSKKLASTIQKKQTLLKSHALETALNKRKIESHQQEATAMETNVQEAAYCNSKLLTNIHEQKQLTSMYETVIDELKDQIKLERHDKGDLLKKLAILKKNEKSTVCKLSTQETNTNEMFRKIYLSLQKWK